MGTKDVLDKKTNQLLTRLQTARNNFPPSLQKAVNHAGNVGEFAALVLGRYGNNRETCIDPTLDIPWGKADADKVKKIKEYLMDKTKIYPQDKTPLAKAFEIAKDEIEKKTNPAIVLVSDGLETCDGNLQKAVCDLGAAAAWKLKCGT